MAKIKLSEHFTYTKLLKFTYPTIIMMIFTSIYVIIDGILISNYAGGDAFAAINIVYPILSLFGSVGFMIGSGGSALVSKTLGEEKKELAKKYFSMLIYFDIFMGIILSIIGSFILRPVAHLLGAEGEILENGVLYGKILLYPLTVCILQNTFQSFMVAAERPKLGLCVTVLAGVNNIVLDVILIFVLKLGIKGAAISTCVSQCIGGLIPLIFFMCNNGTNYRLVKTGFDFKVIGKACLNGISEMMMVMSVAIVNMLYYYQLLRIAGKGGAIAYGIVQYSSYIFEMFFTGYSNGQAPIVSFHFGAKNPDELKNLFKKGLIINFISSIIIFGASEACAPLLTKIFVGYDNALYEIGLPAVRIYLIVFLLTGYNVFASSFFTGLNNGIISAIISLSRTLIFEVSMIFILPLFFGIYGIWMSVSVAEGITVVVSFTLLYIYRKKYQYF